MNIIQDVRGFRATHIVYAVAFLFLFVPAGLSHATTVAGDTSLSQNLVSYWQMEEQSGTRVDSKSGYNLTDNNSVGFSTGIQGSAGNFTRASSMFFNRGDDLGISANSNFSTSFWFKLKSDPTTGQFYQFLSYKLGSGSSESAYYLDYRNESGTYKLSADRSGSVAGSFIYQLGGAIGTSNWHHVVTVYDGSTYTMYYDGAVVASSSASGINDQGSAGVELDLGRFRDGNGNVLSRYPDAYIDEVGVWNKALSASDVTTLYNSGSGIAYGGATGGRKSADQTVTSSVALQNDDDLTRGLAANTTYSVDVMLFATSTSEDPDVKIAFASPSGTTIDLGYMAFSKDGFAGVGLLEGSAASEKISLSSGGPTIIMVSGTVKTGGTTGSLTLQWAQNAASTAGVTIKEGSYIKVSQL